MAEGPHVRLSGVAKRFGGVRALRGVDLDIARGAIHGLVGENGAGKSTLGKIIAGVHRPDAGRIVVDGRPASYGSPREALADGIAIIAQELSLVPQLTVMENVLLGAESRRMGVVRAGRMRRRFRELDALGFGLPGDALVGSLSVAEQQKVEIMRAVARDVRLIVMDEPTTSLTPDEAAHLYAVMREQAARGTTIVFISHALEAVLELCDTITVLRDGAIVRTAPAADERTDTLVTAMVGRSLDATFPARRPAPATAPVVLAVRGLGTAGWVRDVSFEVRAGEILGVAGLIGSGRSEVARAVYGADRLQRGEIELDGQPLRNHSVRESVRRGLVMLPESRKAQGLILGTSVLENVTLPHLHEFQAGGVVRRGRERRRAVDLCEAVGVRGAPLTAPVASLSGGNQQKVMFAKWLCRTPRVLLADEPTRGVDVAAKRAIYDLLTSLAAQGLAVVVISSELEEVLGLAHRILVMRRGRVAGELPGTSATEAAVLHLAFGTESVVQGAA